MYEQMDRDPFGDDANAGEKPEGYSILRGGGDDADHSEEAQGRRAFWHMRRVRQAQRLGETRRGALKAEIAGLEADLSRAKSALASIEQWTSEQDQVDRMFLRTWLATSPQFTDPAPPRKHTLDFADGLALESATKTVPQKINLVDEAAVMAALPEFVVTQEKLSWGAVRKTLRVVPGIGVVDADGAVVPGVYATPKTSTPEYFALVDGQRIPLQGGIQDGNGTDGDGAGTDASEADAVDDPFGYDA